MQHGINITTDRSFHFVWIVTVDCLSVSASFLALNALKLMAFLLRVLAARWAWRLSWMHSVPFNDSWICFIFCNVVITIWTNIWTVLSLWLSQVQSIQTPFLSNLKVVELKPLQRSSCSTLYISMHCATHAAVYITDSVHKYSDVWIWICSHITVLVHWVCYVNSCMCCTMHGNI